MMLLASKVPLHGPWVERESSLVDHQPQIIRLLKALNGVGPAEASGRSPEKDEADWLARTLDWGADMGLSQEVSKLILSETLIEIRNGRQPQRTRKGTRVSAREARVPVE
jgi:hypothetical protein